MWARFFLLVVQCLWNHGIEDLPQRTLADNVAIKSDGTLVHWGATGPRSVPSGRFCEIISTCANVWCGLRHGSRDVICFGGMGESLHGFPTGVPFKSLSRHNGNTCSVCGIKASDNKLICWGDEYTPSAKHSLGGKEAYDNDTPMKLVTCDCTGCCALKLIDGRPVCWHLWTLDGQVLWELAKKTEFIDLMISYSSVCGIKASDHKIMCWGEPVYGMGSPPSDSVSDLFSTRYLACALKSVDSTLTCWGTHYLKNDRVTFKNPDTAPIPSNVPFTTVYLHEGHYGCGIRKADSKAQCWGHGGDFVVPDVLLMQPTASTKSVARRLGVSCTTWHMTCPVPSVASGTYKVLGSENVNGCSVQTSNGSYFFHFAFGACNTTRVERADSRTVEETATLIYHAPSFGSLLIGSERKGAAGAPAVVVCTCELQMAAEVASGQMKTAPTAPTAPGHSETRNLSFEMYLTDAFNTSLRMGAVIPELSQRLYFKVSSDKPAGIVSLPQTDVVGLVNCTASPTSSIEDRYAAPFVSNSCPVGPLDYLVHPTTEKDAIKSSILNFKFAGSKDIFILCYIIRCEEEPCGRCAATHDAQQLQSKGTWVKAGFRARFSTSPLILPGPLLSQNATVAPVWEPLATPQLGKFDVRTNLTLFGFEVNASESLQHLAGAVTAALSRFFSRGVQVIRILAVTLPSARMLSDGSGSGALRAEALITESAMQAVHLQDRAAVVSQLASLSQGSEMTAEFARSLHAEMESRGLSAPTHLQIVVGRAAELKATPVPGEMHRGTGASGAPVLANASIAMICVACLLACCVGSLLAFRWWRRRRRSASRKVQSSHGMQSNDLQSTWQSRVLEALPESDWQKKLRRQSDQVPAVTTSNGQTQAQSQRQAAVLDTDVSTETRLPVVSAARTGATGQTLDTPTETKWLTVPTPSAARGGATGRTPARLVPCATQGWERDRPTTTGDYVSRQFIPIFPDDTHRLRPISAMPAYQPSPLPQVCNQAVILDSIEGLSGVDQVQELVAKRTTDAAKRTTRRRTADVLSVCPTSASRYQASPLPKICSCTLADREETYEETVVEPVSLLRIVTSEDAEARCSSQQQLNCYRV